MLNQVVLVGRLTKEPEFIVNDTIRMYKKRNLEMYKIVHENPQKVHSFLIY